MKNISSIITMEKSKKRGLVNLIIIIFLLQLMFITADGGYFPPPGQHVSPGEQKAVIYYDSEKSLQTLIINSEFQGNARDLAWIIPTPTKPDVKKANKVIFEKFDVLTKPEKNSGSFINSGSYASEKTISEGVYVYESKKVDYYDINILYATNSQDLIEWFNKNNYQYPENQSSVLQHYIDKGWFFTAIKVSPESSEIAEKDTIKGTPTPVKMVFKTDKIVFPLKISAIDFSSEKNSRYEMREDKKIYYSDSHIPIHIFMIGEGKYETSNNHFRTQYANWFEKSELQNALKDNEGNNLIELSGDLEKEYFVTRIFANIPKTEMDSDIYFNYADNNARVNTGPTTAQIIFQIVLIFIFIILGFVLSPLGWILIGGALIIFISKNKNIKIIGWIMEGFVLGVISLFTFILLIIGLFAYGFPDIMFWALVFSSLIIIASIIILMIIQRKKSKKGNKK